MVWEKIRSPLDSSDDLNAVELFREIFQAEILQYEIPSELSDASVHR